MKNRQLLANPFARALAAKPEPDDLKATSPAMYIVFGLLSMVLAALFVAALVLPPLFTYSLIVRGVRVRRPSRHRRRPRGFSATTACSSTPGQHTEPLGSDGGAAVDVDSTRPDGGD